MAEKIKDVLCVIPCGKAKIWEREPDRGPVAACEVYTGSFARATLAYARRFYEHWVILSAKHGFLLPKDLVPGPYEVTFSRPADPNVVTTPVLRQQVAAKELDRFDHVVVVAGSKYVAPVRAAFAGRPVHITAPLLGLTSMGAMISALKSAVAMSRRLEETRELPRSSSGLGSSAAGGGADRRPEQEHDRSVAEASEPPGEPRPLVPGTGRADTDQLRVVTKALLAFGKTINGARLIPALSPAASTFVHDDPFAFLLGASLDRGIPAEVAWTFPLWIRERLGHLDPRRIAVMDVAEIDAVLASCPRLPRYRSAAPRTVREVAGLVMRVGAGDARKVWEGRRATDVHQLLRSVHGIGEGIASMVLALLDRVFKIPLDDLDRRSMDVKADVHVVRVLTRLGLLEVDDADESSAVEGSLAVTRAMHPSHPALLDPPLWVIGRTWCKAFDPDCGACPVTEVCAKRVSQAQPPRARAISRSACTHGMIHASASSSAPAQRFYFPRISSDLVPITRFVRAGRVTLVTESDQELRGRLQADGGGRSFSGALIVIGEEDHFEAHLPTDRMPRRLRAIAWVLHREGLRGTFRVGHHAGELRIQRVASAN